MLIFCKQNDEISSFKRCNVVATNDFVNTQLPSKRQENDVRDIIYHDDALLLLRFSEKKEFEIVTKFDQPPALAKEVDEREE